MEQITLSLSLGLPSALPTISTLYLLILFHVDFVVATQDPLLLRIDPPTHTTKQSKDKDQSAHANSTITVDRHLSTDHVRICQKKLTSQIYMLTNDLSVFRCSEQRETALNGLSIYL